MSKGYRPPAIKNAPQEGEVYRHYKGDLYKVIGLAIHSNDDVWMVVYEPLYENADAQLFTLPVTDWLKIMDWGEKQVERFTLVTS